MEVIARICEGGGGCVEACVLAVGPAWLPRGAGPVTPTAKGQRAWILPGGGACPLDGLQMRCRQLENVTREIRMSNWSNGVVVLHVGCKGKSTKLKKDGKGKQTRQAPEIPAGREPGK